MQRKIHFRFHGRLRGVTYLYQGVCYLAYGIRRRLQKMISTCIAVARLWSADPREATNAVAALALTHNAESVYTRSPAVAQRSIIRYNHKHVHQSSVVRCFEYSNSHQP